MTLDRKKLGAAGENAAALCLRRKGYRIMARNWRCPSGELDIVARRHELMVFCEVKTRVTDQHAHPMQNVTHEKQRHVAAAARCFLREKKLLDADYRFDVITIIWGSGKRPEKIEHHEGAFSEGRR
jgi:putative endonuclease